MLRKIEEALQTALEKPFQRLFPPGLQPAELKARLRAALENSLRETEQGAVAANDYRLEMNLADYRRLEAVGPALEKALAAELERYAREIDVTVGPYLNVSVGAAEDVPSGEARISAQFSAPPPAFLIVEAGLPLVGRHVPLQERNVIGRAPDCHIVIGEATISRRHCEIAWEYVQYIIRDLGSANGTFVNGRQITQAGLRDGDLIEIGIVQLRFRDSLSESL